MKATGLPRLFIAASRKRSLWALALLALLSGLAMLPAMATMADHGASLTAFESAGSVSRSQEILTGWGSAGKNAMWWQLALDTSFLFGYGLLLAGACAAVARRAAASGMPRLEHAAVIVAWFGPVAASADFVQNISLGLILSGHVVQPWPRISALAGIFTMTLMAIGVIFVVVGVMLTRSSTEIAEPSGGAR
jgi:hypothetical protein